MKTCNKCGTTLNEDLKFCPQCGAEILPDADTENKNGFAQKVMEINNTTDSTSEFDSKDIEENKYISLLAYLGVLVFVPMFVKKDSKFTRFHSNQGLLLLILGVAHGILQIILHAILRAIFPWRWSYGLVGGRGPVYGVLSTVLSLLWIAVAALAVIGIINAVTGKAKELPFIGKIKLLK